MLLTGIKTVREEGKDRKWESKSVCYIGFMRNQDAT